MAETTGILFDLFIIFAAARLAGELFLRLKQPAIVGEVLAGEPILSPAAHVAHAQSFTFDLMRK